MNLKVKVNMKNVDTKVLMSNFSYLSIIEISNYILPFLSIPYIVKTIGVEKFGIIIFSYAVMASFNIITDFGFKLLATKYISINRENINKVSRYFWTVISSQILLLLVSFLIFMVLLVNVEKFSQEKLIFIYSFGMVIGNTLFPVWFFQGMERMKYIAIFNIISRVIYTVLIFTVIKSKDDYIFVPLFNSLSFIFIGIVSLYFIHKEFKVNFVLASLKDIKLLFIEGWYLFLSSLSNNLYTSANTILLGLLTNYSVVGVLSLATTISGAITKIIKIYSRVTYPYIAKFSNDYEVLLSKARLLLRVYFILLVVVGVATFLLAEPLIYFLFGPTNEESILLLRVLALAMVVEPLGGFFTTYLVIKNQTKTIAKITFYTMVINFLFIFPLIVLFQGLGFVISKLIVESFQVMLNIIHNKELIFNKKKEI